VQLRRDVSYWVRFCSLSVRGRQTSRTAGTLYPDALFPTVYFHFVAMVSINASTVCHDDAYCWAFLYAVGDMASCSLVEIYRLIWLTLRTLKTMVSASFSKTLEKKVVDYAALHLWSALHHHSREKNKFSTVIYYGEAIRSSSCVLQVAWFSYFWLWRWKQHIPPNRRYTVILHGLTFKNDSSYTPLWEPQNRS
jgi:hypothetical protein